MSHPQRRQDMGLSDPNFLKSILDASPSPLIVLECVDTDPVIVYANPAFERRTGYVAEQIVGRDWRSLYARDTSHHELERLRAAVHAGHSAHAVLRSHCRDGGTFWSELDIAPLGPDEAGVHFVGVVRDISADWAQREQLERRALHDALTGLPNRHLLQDRLDRAIAYAASRNRSFAVVLVDLDQFKQINDTFGHEAGDEVLKQIATRLTRVVRAGDTVARLGGDEFVLVFESLTTDARVSEILTRLDDLVECPVSIAGVETAVGCSVGISWYPFDGGEAPALLRSADAAMYRVKKQRSRVERSLGVHWAEESCDEDQRVERQHDLRLR